MSRHPIWELLDKIQMDNRDTAAKIVELRAHFASLDLGETKTHGQWQPAFGVKDPFAATQRLIANGVIQELVDLEAELAAHPALGTAERAALVALLEAQTQA